MAAGGDRPAGVVFLALGAGICVGASRLGFGSIQAPQPGFFPWLGGLALIALSAALYLGAARGDGAPMRASRGDWSRPATLLGALIVYVAILEPVGYPLATIGLLLVALHILSIRRWSVMLMLSVGLALGSFLLFRRGLGVELPPGVTAFLG